jgi:hypothetical protein
MTGKKLWAMILAGLLLFGLTGMAFGEDTKAPSTPDEFQEVPGALNMDRELGKALDELITVNVITADQKGKIIEYFEKGLKDGKPIDQRSMAVPKKDGNDPIGLLVKDNVINQAQAAILARITPRPFPRPCQMQTPPDPEKIQVDLQKKLEELVQSKKITAKQKDTILKFFADKVGNRPDKRLDAKPGNDKDLKGGPNDFFTLLVQCSIITEKQADAIAAVSEVMPGPMPGFMIRGCGPNRPFILPEPKKMKVELQNKLDTLVKSKIITEKQKDSIIKYISDDFTVMKGLKPGEGPGEDDVVEAGPKDPLSRLVKDGVITQEQADMVRKVIIRPQPPADPGPEHSQP